MEGVERMTEVVERTINSISRDVNRSGGGDPDYLLLRLLVARFRDGELGPGHRHNRGCAAHVSPTSLCRRWVEGQRGNEMKDKNSANKISAELKWVTAMNGALERMLADGILFCLFQHDHSC